MPLMRRHYASHGLHGIKTIQNRIFETQKTEDNGKYSFISIVLSEKYVTNLVNFNGNSIDKHSSHVRSRLMWQIKY